MRPVLASMTTTAPESALYLRPVILSVSWRTVFIAWCELVLGDRLDPGVDGW